jgi:hypothetical protein
MPGIFPVIILASVLGSAMFSPLAFAAVGPGEPAPDFILKDVNGSSYSISGLKGKFVVLEWVNFGCPFVQKHYRSGNMPALQKFAKDKEVVWLSICSSAPGKQGYFEMGQIAEEMSKMHSNPTGYLPDPDGKVGMLYGAKSTPTTVLLDPKGNVLYFGAIDSIPSTDVDDVAKARNYLKEALDLALAGKGIEVKSSKAYGCSVKY